MRRARFAIGGESESHGTAPSSVSEALTFDLRVPDEPNEATLASRRAAGLVDIPLLLGLTHLLCGLGLIVDSVSSGAGMPVVLGVVLGISLLLDIAALLVLRNRRRYAIEPHIVTIGTCAYAALSGSLWLGVAGAAMAATGGSAMLYLAIGGGLAMGVLAAAASPPVAAVNALVAMIGAAIFTPGATAIIATLGLVLAGLLHTVNSSRMMIAEARSRLQLDQLAQKALRFVAEFENSGRGWFWETNAQGTLSYVSQQLADDFNTTPEALLGRQFTDLLSVDTSPIDSLREERTLGFHLSARFPFSDVVVRAASDDNIHWSLSGNPVFDPHGRFLGFRGIGTDLTEQRRSEQEISRLARFDSLTGLPNRALMRQTLDEALRNSARRQKGCALFLIDLDRFKNVNDTLGHPAGDALLRQVAQRLSNVMGKLGQIGRLGGDEFKAVIPGVVEQGILESLARQLIEEVSKPYMVEGHRVTIGASVGIAIGDLGRSCADSLIRNADLALYAAKAAGRGKHCFFESSMHSEASDRQLLENDLRQAIERGELWVAFQPIVKAADEEITGFESLVRWTHPVRGPISPAVFIPLAEECGLIPSLGAWVLDQAVGEATRWPDKVRVAVNLSPIQFNDPGIVSLVAAALRKHQLRAERLELEITEGVFLADNSATDDTFARLKALGVRLALDDFGTGYSSLGYLKKAPFDKIKIDQSFVKGAASTSSRNRAIIKAIVTLAESLGMDTTAEGVETHDDLQLIRELGCSQVQGFIFGKAVNGAAARELAANASIAAEGFHYVRPQRQRLMRRAIVGVGREAIEIRLRNISEAGALAECAKTFSPGTQLTIDIVGVGPVVGSVRWAQEGRFGIQFDEPFDLGRLAPRQSPASVARPWYVNPPENKSVA